MASFRCTCGELIRTSGPIPNPIEWRLLKDEAFDVPEYPVLDGWTLTMGSVTAYRCPRSDHLYVFWDGIENAPSLYTPTPIEWREL